MSNEIENVVTAQREPEMEMPATGAESPNGANFRLVSPAGTWLQFTMRRGRMSAVIDDFRKLEKILIAEGWTQPPSKEQSGAKVAAPSGETKECPIHHVDMKQRTGKDGSSFFSHKTEDKRYTSGWCNGREPKGAE